MSTNTDLWSELFDLLESRDLRLKLYWVPSHMDKKRPKSNMFVPDDFFPLNFFPDYFPNLVAKRVQVDLNCASGVLFYSGLVGKIQKRLVRILISHIQKHVYDKKFPVWQPKNPRCKITLLQLGITCVSMTKLTGA